MRTRALLQFPHHADHELFRVRQAFVDQLDVHRRFARLAGALAIDAVLSDEDEGVGEEVEGEGEAASFLPHLEFVAIEVGGALLEDGHSYIG